VQRFPYADKHRRKVFEVTPKTRPTATMQVVQYKDVATGETRTTRSNRKTCRMEVELITTNRVGELTPNDIDILKSSLVESYLRACEVGRQSTDGEAINALMLKITGLPGRRVVLPEGE